MAKLGFIGAGKVSTALAMRLSGKGYPVAAVHDVEPEAHMFMTKHLAEGAGCLVVVGECR